MAVKKNTIRKESTTKRAVKKSILKKGSVKKNTAKAQSNPLKLSLSPRLPTKSKVLYIDACFFFPPGNGAYTDNFQDGRYAANGMLMAPILLRVGSVIKSVTIYYKNNTKEEMSVWILKYHIDHHAYSGEVEVSYEGCPPGVAPPDNFLQKKIDHFDAGGKILDKYMYHIEVSQTMKTATQERLLRGIRIVYTEPA